MLSSDSDQPQQEPHNRPSETPKRPTNVNHPAEPPPADEANFADPLSPALGSIEDDCVPLIVDQSGPSMEVPDTFRGFVIPPDWSTHYSIATVIADGVVERHRCVWRVRPMATPG